LDKFYRAELEMITRRGSIVCTSPICVGICFYCYSYSFIIIFWFVV